MADPSPEKSHWTDWFPLSVLVIFWDAVWERISFRIREFKRRRHDH